MDEDFQDTGDDAADGAGFSAVVAKLELVEIRLEVLATDGAMVRTNPEPPDQRNRVVRVLDGIRGPSRKPFDDDLLMPPPTDRRPVVCAIAIGRDTRAL